MGKAIGNNDTSIGQSSKINRAEKNRLDITNKGRVGETNIKVKVGWDKVDKDGT